MIDKYKINKTAKNDLVRIYEYGFHKYGETQADEYYYAFFERFEQLVKNPYSYPRVDYICEGYRRSVCGSDCIYYRIVNSTIEIMRILGQQDTNNLN